MYACEKVNLVANKYCVSCVGFMLALLNDLWHLQIALIFLFYTQFNGFPVPSLCLGCCVCMHYCARVRYCYIITMLHATNLWQPSLMWLKIIAAATQACRMCAGVCMYVQFVTLVSVHMGAASHAIDIIALRWLWITKKRAGNKEPGVEAQKDWTDNRLVQVELFCCYFLLFIFHFLFNFSPLSDVVS